MIYSTTDKLSKWSKKKKKKKGQIDRAEPHALRQTREHPDELVGEGL